MESNTTHSSERWISLHDSCLTMMTDLKETLLVERGALISLNTDTVAETTAKKEYFLQQIRLRQKQISEFGGEPLLNETQKKKWNEMKTRWDVQWEELRRICEFNQRFMRHSLKNFSLLADNLKRLLGVEPVYSPTGQKRDLSNEGRLVEVRY